MFMVSEAAAQAIRRAYDESGELAAVAELRRHFPLVVDTAHARQLVRTIAGWRTLPPRQAGTTKATGPAKQPRQRRKPPEA